MAAEAGNSWSLVPDIRRAAELIQEIAAASTEQSFGADQIAKGVGQMDMVVQQNASVSEELAGTAEELTAQAERLKGPSGFKLGDEAPSAGKSAVPTTKTVGPRASPSASPAAAPRSRRAAP